MSQDIKQQISGWIDANREYGTHLLQRLVQSPSLQGEEKAVQGIVTEVLASMGLEIDEWEPGGETFMQHPDFYSNRKDFSGSPNVVGVWKGEGGGRSIILNGHVDVVPAGDRSQWAEDPFSGTIKDGRLYGRGSTDMKGGNVSLLLAVKALKESGIRLQGDVIFESVVEEESGGAGTLAAVLRGYKADAAIIPEPTNMKIFPKQQGSMWFRIKVHGRAAHGGTRYEGVSAIEKSMAVMEHVQRLEEKRNARITDPLFKNIPIPVPINIGKIEGGDWPSSVADLVTIEGRIGIAPDETAEEVQAEFRQWLGELAALDPWFDEHPAKLEWFGARWQPGMIEPDHPLMATLVSQFQEVTGTAPAIEASPWGTDGGMLTVTGGIPTVVFGPGTTEVAHFPNESIELERVFRAAEIIACTVADWCGIKEKQETGGMTKDAADKVH
ncbi:peptidase [Indiicoccus explosivorum]|uniref:peptidase n=1 Tax=Indiicoccus explosivorum TaxID=1917864 RepID=UPI001F4D47CE|nr:peptidase [Indiicoccus explosivorum]